MNIRSIFGIGPWRATMLSALMITAAHPPLDLGPIVIIAFVPWLLALPHFKTTRGAIFAGYLVGMIVFGVDMFYISQMEAGAEAGPWMYGMWVFALLAVFGPFYAAFAGAARFAMAKLPRWSWLIVLPILWTGIEYTRYYVPVPSPFLSIGYALHHAGALIQIAELGGVHLVSIFVLLVNTGFAAGLLAKKNGNNRAKKIYYGIVLIACAANLIYGTARMLALKDEMKSDGPIVACIQPNVPQDVKLATQTDAERWQAHEEMSREAAKPALDAKLLPRNRYVPEAADLICWSETAVPQRKAFPVNYPEWQPLQYDPRTLARSLDTPMLFGAFTEMGSDEHKTRFPWLAPDEWPLFNTAWYVNGEGKAVGRFDKTHLVAGGEYIPYRGTPLGDFIAEYAEVLAGFVPSIAQGYRTDTFTLTDKLGRDWRFSANICYEFAFPQLYQHLHGKKNVHFAVTLTNEGWYFKSGELDGAVIMTQFRAIESRCSFVRATNTGIGCIVDPAGNVRSVLKDKDGETKQVKGVLIDAVPYLPNPQPTLFLRSGNTLMWCTTVPALALMAWAIGAWFAAWPARWRAKKAAKRSGSGDALPSSL